jgi:hypothetical protein
MKFWHQENIYGPDFLISIVSHSKVFIVLTLTPITTSHTPITPELGYGAACSKQGFSLFIIK